MSFTQKHGFHLRPQSFFSIWLLSTPFTHKYLPKQGNPGITTFTQAHADRYLKECEVIRGISSPKCCDTIRRRKKGTLFSKWQITYSFLFAFPICCLPCLHLGSLKKDNDTRWLLKWQSKIHGFLLTCGAIYPSRSFCMGHLLFARHYFWLNCPFKPNTYKPVLYCFSQHDTCVNQETIWSCSECVASWWKGGLHFSPFLWLTFESTKTFPETQLFFQCITSMLSSVSTWYTTKSSNPDLFSMLSCHLAL